MHQSRVIRLALLLALGAVAAPLAPQPPAPPAAGPPFGPDSQVQQRTPTGEVIRGEFAASRIYPGTWRESNVEFGGANMDEMFVTNGDKIFTRKTKVKGVASWRAPIKPAPPRL
jgi:hypothetical protein